MYENYSYYLTKDTKQFLLLLVNHYVEILLIQVSSKIYDHLTYAQNKQLAKSRSIKDYKQKFKEDLIKILHCRNTLFLTTFFNQKRVLQG